MRMSAYCLAAAIVVMCPSAALAQAPGPASGASVSGDVAGIRPTFTWGAVPSSTWYYLWVRDSTGADRLIQWYSAETAGCATGPVCSVTLDLVLATGLTQWWVQTWNASGYGPWSATRSVRVSPLYSVASTSSLFLGSYPPGGASGVSNVGVGASTLSALTTGANNVAFGVGALANAQSANANIAIGTRALMSTVTGATNVAIGVDALRGTTTGVLNTVVGHNSGFWNGDGDANTVFGGSALFFNSTGHFNVAVGALTLQNMLSSSNVALGYSAGRFLETGSSNIFIGHNAGTSMQGFGDSNIVIGTPGVNGDSNTIRIGITPTHTATYLAGVYAATVTSRVVYVDSTGRLGTLSSSRASKRNIRPLGDVSARLFDLRPVAFQYRSSPVGSGDVEYGLIAEEVAKTFPELVDLGMSGKPETVRYHLLTPLLLNELQKARADVDSARADVDMLMTELRTLKARLAALEARTPERR